MCCVFVYEPNMLSAGPSVLVSGGFGELNMNKFEVTSGGEWEGAGGPLSDVRGRAGGTCTVRSKT